MLVLHAGYTEARVLHVQAIAKPSYHAMVRYYDQSLGNAAPHVGSSECARVRVLSGHCERGVCRRYVRPAL